MREDRWFWGIIGAILLLAVLAVAVFFVRQSQQAYLSEDTPDGVINNYAMALYQGDYQRAFNYLQDADNKPSRLIFEQAFLSGELDISSLSIQIGEVRQNDGQAWVTVKILHGSSGPFQESWQETSSAALRKQADSWKIVSMPYPFWGWNWYSSSP